MPQDPVTQEGSAARAKDRGRPFGLEHFESEQDDERPYLGDPVAVEALVRDFCGRVHQANSGFNEGSVPGSKAQERIADDISAVAAIFHGKNTAYRAAAFNTPEALGGLVKARMGYSDAPGIAVATLLWATIGQIITAADALLAGTLTDDDARFQVDAAVDDAVSALLGLPLGMSISGTSE